MVILKNINISGSLFVGEKQVLFLSDERGADWYESQRLFKDDTLKVVFNASGVIVSMSYDVSALWPVGNSVAEVLAAAVPEGVNIDGGWVFNGKKIVPRIYTQEELIAKATSTLDVLMATAEAAIAPLQRAVKYGIATDAEKQLLEEWEMYTVTLSRLDLATAPDTDWPLVPGQ